MPEINDINIPVIENANQVIIHPAPAIQEEELFAYFFDVGDEGIVVKIPMWTQFITQASTGSIVAWESKPQEFKWGDENVSYINIGGKRLKEVLKAPVYPIILKEIE